VRRTTGKYAAVALALLLAACQTTGGHPPAADIEAAIEAKPAPTAEILTPGGDARYSASIEATLDRVHAAAMRLCRFHQRTGMKVKCGE